MKKLLIFLSVIYSSISNANALEWGDLELYERYTLKEDIVFPGVIDFKKGDSFDFYDRIGGNNLVMYFQFHSVKCENPDLTSEMILMNPSPEDTARDRTIALQLEEGCNIGIWVEVRDYYSPSLFLNLGSH
jgi:hypothetical protein